MDRYARQVSLPQVGPEGQALIRAATVLVVGAGGLGCAVLSYLAAAGVGRIVLADHDRVDVTNLHRQPLYRMSDVGKLKVHAARSALSDLNPLVRIDAMAGRLGPANADALARHADIVVDAADSFAVTYVLSDVCARLKKPLISASVLGMSGYVGGFCGSAPSYRAVFPDMPSHAGTCASAGVLGTAVGVMGTLQAHTVLSVILHLEPSPLGRIVSVDFTTLRFGGFSFGSALEPTQPVFSFIAVEEASNADLIVDLRGMQEAPVPAFPASVRAGADEVERVADGAPASQRIVLCCRSGVRAWRAASKLRERGRTNLALIALGD
ncbi:MAG: HesA/MoeB/ThiF family protein [Gammaproteobacteria bacterium]